MLDTCLEQKTTRRVRMRDLQMRVFTDVRYLMVFSYDQYYGMAPLSEPGQYPTFIAVDGARVETRFLRGAIDEAHNHPAHFQCEAASGEYPFCSPATLGRFAEREAIAWWLQHVQRPDGAHVLIQGVEYQCLPYRAHVMRTWQAGDLCIDDGRFMAVGLEQVNRLVLPEECVYRPC